MRVGDLLEVTARRYPTRLAARDSARAITYAEYRSRARRIANALAGLGCRPGDRVALVLANSVEYAELIVGLAMAGVVTVHVSDRLSAEEMGYLFTDSEARTVIYDGPIARAVAKAIDVSGWRPSLPAVSVGPSDGLPALAYGDWLATASDRPPPRLRDPLAPFYLGYTSGTTGRPKGARITHDSRVLTALASCAEYGLGDDEVHLMCTPMHHGGPLVFVLTTLMQGGQLVIMSHFDTEQALATIAEERITSAFVVPTILRRLADARGEVAASSVRTLISNAAPLPTVVKEATFAAFPGVRLHEFYGSTEAGIVTNLRPEDQLRKTRCAGQPFLFTEVEILDTEGTPVGPGEVGELYSRSPYLFDGYHKLPDATTAATRNGMVSAGDLARSDEEGYVYIVDRKNDMIISGGVNIYPREIEEALLGDPRILDAAVIGVPDPEWGERVKAYVVLRDSGLDADTVVREATGSLARFKRPRVVEASRELPRNATGKVLKRELRDQAWHGQEAQI